MLFELVDQVEEHLASKGSTSKPGKVALKFFIFFYGRFLTSTNIILTFY